MGVLENFPKETVNAFGRQIGPLKVWQYGVIIIVPLGIWTFLKRKKGGGEAEAGPANTSNGLAGAYPTSSGEWYSAESIALMGRFDEGFGGLTDMLGDMLRLQQEGIGETPGAPPYNLSILSYNLDRVADLPRFANQRELLTAWSSRVSNMLYQGEWDGQFLEQVVGFLRAAGLPVDTLYADPANPTPPVTEPPTTEPPTTEPPTTEPPTTEPPTNNDPPRVTRRPRTRTVTRTATQPAPAPAPAPVVTAPTPNVVWGGPSRGWVQSYPG